MARPPLSSEAPFYSTQRGHPGVDWQPWAFQMEFTNTPLLEGDTHGLSLD